MINWDGVSNLARVNLFDSWLILEALSVSFDMLGCPRAILAVLVRLNTEFSPLGWSHDNVFSSRTDVRGCLEPAS
jgi:hypothetical protein